MCVDNDVFLWSAGVGKEHAKWSPVATAFYRMMPTITLPEGGVWGEDADRLVKAFPPGVLALQRTRRPDGGHQMRAVVADARLERHMREHERDDKLRPLVQLGRDEHHFLFSIESTGAVPPAKLFLDAVNVLGDKCERFLREVEAVAAEAHAAESADVPMLRESAT